MTVRSTGVSIKRGLVERSQDVTRDIDRSGMSFEDHHRKVQRGESVKAVVRGENWPEIEAILIQDVLALASAKDENLLVAGAAARGTLRSLEKIYRAIREGEQSQEILTQIERAKKEEMSDEAKTRQPVRPRTRSYGKPVGGGSGKSS